MTLASTMFGGGGSVAYLAGNLYTALPLAVGTGVSVVNTDHLIPFSPRRTMTVDKVAWYRDNTSAGNVYVGIYNSAGTLLTDCAVDSNTTAGWHAVDTTNVTLIAGLTYYLCWNGSVDVAGTWALLLSTTPNADGGLVDTYGYNLTLGLAPSTSDPAIYSKARTNAALLSSLTLSGWSQPTGSRVPCMGVVAA